MNLLLQLPSLGNAAMISHQKLLKYLGVKHFENKNKRKSSFSSHLTDGTALTLSIFHTKQSRVSPAETPPYIMFDKYLKGSLFHPAEPFQPTDETETAATGEEWKCEQNTERSSEY